MAPLSPTEAESRRRLIRFDRWLYGVFARNMVWPAEREKKSAGIFRARAMMNLFCLRLAQRGFYFDGRELADMIEGLVREMGDKQRAGEIQSLWPFMRGFLESHVPRNADRLRARAMELGCHASQVSGGTPLVTLAGERFSRAAHRRVAEKVAKRSRQEAARRQAHLLGKGRITQLSAEAQRLRDEERRRLEEEMRKPKPKPPAPLPPVEEF